MRFRFLIRIVAATGSDLPVIVLGDLHLVLATLFEMTKQGKRCATQLFDRHSRHSHIPILSRREAIGCHSESLSPAERVGERPVDRSRRRRGTGYQAAVRVRTRVGCTFPTHAIPGRLRTLDDDSRSIAGSVARLRSSRGNAASAGTALLVEEAAQRGADRPERAVAGTCDRDDHARCSDDRDTAAERDRSEVTSATPPWISAPDHRVDFGLGFLSSLLVPWIGDSQQTSWPCACCVRRPKRRILSRISSAVFVQRKGLFRSLSVWTY